MRFVNNPFTDKLDVGSLTGSGAPPVETVSGNDGISVGPDGTTFNLDLLGDNAQGVNVTGDAGTNTLTISGIDASETQKGVLETSSNTEAAAQSSTSVALTPSNIPSLFSSTPLSASQGGTGVSSPAANSLLVTNGSSAFTVLGTAGNGQIPIGAIGSAPVLANLASSDASIVITNGPGTIDLTVAATTAGVTTLTGNTGGAIAPVLGNINTVGTGNITVAGAGNTLTAELTGLTNHNVLIGAGTATVTNLAPSATSGIPLISQGSSADPTFGTAVVVGGGTGATSFTAHSLILGQGTSSMTSLGSATNGQIPIGSTGADPVLGNITSTGGSITVSNTAGAIDISTTVTTPTGALGTVLQGQGIGSNPAYSTATYPSTSGTSGKVLISDGTNIVASTPTFPNASATAGKFIRSDGTNWIASTPTLPTSAGTSGKHLQSDGTNYVETTATYPSTATGTGTLLRADGTNWVPTTATFPTTAGASGNVLTSNGTNWSSAVPASFTSVVIQKFTASGTYTPTSGMKYCIVECVGGGGGSGNNATTSSNTVACSGGGGGGGYVRQVLSAATVGASKTVTIGGGGAAGSPGSSGGTTTFGTLISAFGGAGTGYGLNTFITVTGAVGGGGSVTSGTALIVTGGAGGSSMGLYTTGGWAISPPNGGSSYFGGGPVGNGVAGTNYGTGASGAYTGPSTAGTAGAAGAAGIVIITEFI